MSRCERTVAPSWSRRMRAAIDAEYAEVLERLPDFFTELDAETTRGRVTFAEVEESEADLARFRAWVAKIAARDYFTAADAEALALRTGMTLSALLRGLILSAIDKELEREETMRKMRGQ